MSTVNSFDEWSQLKEVIVGSVNGFSGFPLDNSFALFYWENFRPFLISNNYFRNEEGKVTFPILNIEPRIIDELNQDIGDFVDALEALGIIVHRPSIVVGNTTIQTPFWESIQSPPLNIRDQAIILGSSIVETAPHVRARLFENDYLKPLFYQFFSEGARWISMPRPTLAAGTLDRSFFSLNSEDEVALKDNRIVSLQGLGFEIVFDGAQCIRLGKDILVNVANQNHELGYQWLRSNFGDTFNFYRLNRMADSHIDSIILPLRPGLWLVRNPRFLNYLPAKFRNWDYIVSPPLEPYLANYKAEITLSSEYLDMNLLSVDESTVIANSLNREMIKVLEKAGFNVIPIRHRHGRLFGGGFHCFTLDVCRTGGLDSY